MTTMGTDGSERHGGAFDRKMQQLAAQIGRSIEMTLLGECRDEVLQNTAVEKVEPAAGSRMIVTLRVGPPGSRMPKEEVLARIERHRGLIADRIAQDVSRRSVPELSFWVVRDEGTPGEDADDEAEDWDAPSILDDV